MSDIKDADWITRAETYGDIWYQYEDKEDEE